MSLSDHVNKWARETPHKTAIIYNDRDFSYLLFARLIEATRRHLRSRRVRSGTTAVVLIDRLLDAWAAIAAARSLGLNTIALSDLKSAQILNIRNCSCVITTEIEARQKDLSTAILPQAQRIVLPLEIYSSAAIERIHELSDSRKNDSGHICLSSASTGTAKKILFNRVSESMINLRYTPDENDKVSIVNILNYSPSATGGYKFFNATLARGEHIAAFKQTSNYLESILSFDNAFCSLRPSLIPQVYNLSKISNSKPNDKIAIRAAGGSIQYNLVEKITNIITRNFFYAYATSELVGSVLLSKVEREEDLLWLTPKPERVVEIVDSLGTPVGLGQEGEIRIGLTEGDPESYLDDDEASSKVFRDGYFYPGDLAVMRADGRVRILGRITETIEICGKKLPVAPIEAEVAAHLGAAQACVFSRVNEAMETEILVGIEADKQPSALLLSSVNRLFQDVSRVHVVPLKQFPYMRSGKLDRAGVRHFIQSALAR